VEADLLVIARGQVALEDELAGGHSHGLIFMDTSLEVLKIWSEVVFGRCDDWIASQMKARLPDHYLLCFPDLPWEFDPLRENPDDRGMLLGIYRREINALDVPCSEVKGSGKQRFENALKAVYHFLNA
jgi:nicotinamide riboside kinase